MTWLFSEKSEHERTLSHGVVSIISIRLYSTFSYRVFSLTWPACMQIYWNKRKRLHKKEFNSQRTGLGNQHGRRFIVSGHQSGLRDVMWKHSIIDYNPPCLPPELCITIVFDFSWDDWEPAKFLWVNKFLYGLCDNGELIFPALYRT